MPDLADIALGRLEANQNMRIDNSLTSSNYVTPAVCTIFAGFVLVMYGIDASHSHHLGSLIAGVSICTMGVCCAIGPGLSSRIKKCWDERSSSQSGYMPIGEHKEPDQTMKV